MTTFPVYFKLGEELKFFRNMSAEEARDERFAIEDIDLHFWDGKTYSIDYRYEAPLCSLDQYHYILKEEHANVQQQDNQ